MGEPMSLFLRFFTTAAAFVALTAPAAPQDVRWTGQDDTNPDFAHVLDVIRTKTNPSLSLSQNDFILLEDRDLATSHFTMLGETAGKVPMRGKVLRIWTSRTTGETIQIEARLDAPPPKAAMAALMTNGGASPLTSRETVDLARNVVSTHLDDRRMGDVSWKDYWENNTLVRVVKVKAAHGTHTVTLSLLEKRVLDQKYEEFPQDDDGGPGAVPGQGVGEYSIPVQIYPIYEEVESTKEILPRVASELRYIRSSVPRPASDPYAALRTQRYLDSKQDPILGLTIEGRKQGLWAMSFLKQTAWSIFLGLPLTDNTFSGKNGVALEGRYATVSLHPKVITAFKGIKFTPAISPVFKPDWVAQAEDPNAQEMIPTSSLHGKPVSSPEEALSRPAQRLPDHDPATYINDGFDELQIYWAVNQMFDSLRPMGFTDPELSTRRFNAFAFDPDIEYRDNAFYTDDTINFTTYSPKAQNYARDNTTIWHELGHGVMDRLMGDYIALADTGGLSEGMADFCAQMVERYAPSSADARVAAA